MKPYTRETEINGKKYIAQFNGLSTALDAIDNCYMDKSDRTSVAKISSYIFKNVIVEPAGLTADDFDDLDELNEVVRWGMNVMQGKFRNEDKKSAKQDSK